MDRFLLLVVVLSTGGAYHLVVFVTVVDEGKEVMHTYRLYLYHTHNTLIITYHNHTK